MSLIETIDAAAERLLAMAGFGDKVEGAEPPPDVTLPEAVKAFDAVVEWAKIRQELQGAAPQRAKFDGIREKFERATGKRRGSRREAETPIDLGDGCGADAAESGGANGHVGADSEPVAEPAPEGDGGLFG